VKADLLDGVTFKDRIRVSDDHATTTDGRAAA